MDARTMSEVTTGEVHEWGARCDRCGGIGFRTDEERARMPGCPMGLEYELPLGPEGLKLAKAREVSARRNAGHDIQRARKAAGLTQAQLASKAGVTRSVVAMGEAGGVWGKEALRKVRHALNHAELTLAALSLHPGMSKRVAEDAQLCSALRGELGELEKQKAERFDWCAKVSQQTSHPAERVEYLLLNCFDENREALLAFLGVDKLSGTSG